LVGKRTRVRGTSRGAIASQALALAITSNARANDVPASSGGYFSTSAALLAGGFWSNREELRGSFAQNGFEMPSNAPVALGLALSVVLRGVHFEAGGVFGNEQLRSPSGTAELRSSHGWFCLGYDVWRHEHTAVFPFFGIGIEELRARFDPQSPPMLEGEMGDLIARLETWREAGQLHGGVGVEHVIRFEPRRPHDPARHAGLLLGARLGYRTPFSDGSWRAADRDFSGGPRLGAEGPFGLVLVGISGRDWPRGARRY
jgi:hypothetical protein